MKNLILVLLSGMLLFSCAPQIYKSANFDAVKQTQEVVAVVPFHASFDPQRLPKRIQGKDLDRVIMHTGYSLQKHAYYYIHNKTYIKGLSIQLQDISLTNDILEAAGIGYDDLMLMDKGELCELLGVDGVISGNIRMSKPMSDAAALVSGVLAGFWGPTNETYMTMTIHNKHESQLIWRYSFQARGSVGSSSEKISRKLIRNVSRHFPYTRN